MGLQNLPRILTFFLVVAMWSFLGDTLKNICLTKLISSESLIA